jgi:hypothetical protein
MSILVGSLFSLSLILSLNELHSMFFVAYSIDRSLMSVPKNVQFGFEAQPKSGYIQEAPTPLDIEWNHKR